MKEFEKVKQKQRTHITQSQKKVITHLACKLIKNISQQEIHCNFTHRLSHS